MRIKINGKFYSFFDEIMIIQVLDSVASSFSFKARFSPDNAAHQDIFRPLSYNVVEIFDNSDNLRLTGVVVNTLLSSSPKRGLQSLSGYSRAGILEDCSIPYSSYPLEKINVSLSDVVGRLLSDFNLKFVVDPSVSNEMRLQYKKTTAQPSESIKAFISKLASQRNIILSHTVEGDLLFYKPDPKSKPKFLFSEKNSLSMSLSVDGQGMHSEISVIRQPSQENPNLTPVDTALNSMVKLKRTAVMVLSSGTETDTKKAADNALANELKNISVIVNLGSFHDLACGDMVEVQNEEIFLYEKTKFIISEITIKEDRKSETMSLKLVLPETFTGESPKNIFE